MIHGPIRHTSYRKAALIHEAANHVWVIRVLTECSPRQPCLLLRGGDDSSASYSCYHHVTHHLIQLIGRDYVTPL